jgi:DNA polymerase I-like protein with 3'-5' exonuclease and polymerase domains
MMWEDYEAPTRATKDLRYVRNVEVPLTGWTPPREFPNLSGVRHLGLDIESKDLQLIEKGPGFVCGAANMVGFSVATHDKAWYFPLAHEHAEGKTHNLPLESTLSWLSSALKPLASVSGANLLYDLEGLRAAGVLIPRSVQLIDVQLAEPLLNETRRSYSLESLAREHLGEGKESDALYDWCAASFGGKADGEQRANIWRAPPSLVGPYAESDALLPMRIYEQQKVSLQRERLEGLFTLESELLPLLLDMRFRGVRIDVDKAQQTALWLREQAALAQAKLKGVDVWSGPSLERAFKASGHEIVYTEAGNASFTKQWLEAQTSELARAVLDVRLYEKAANPFIESYLLGNVHKGRIHCQFHPLRNDTYGTVSGRFSSSNPNLQNIPSRHKVIGPALRSLYLPELNCRWLRGDHSQIEYRLLVHDAVGTGAEELRERYRKDPLTDFHQITIDMTRNITGVTLDRTPAKNLNFGLVYGMGKPLLKASLGVSADLAERLYSAYHQAMPCIKETADKASSTAQRRGYIRTLLGRRRRFNVRETTKYGEQRAGTHAALNARLQGGAADTLKKGMRDCYKAGLFDDDACGIPHLTVHDELDFSIPDTPRAREAVGEMKHMMENCMPMLKVPLIFSLSEGNNWAEAK